MRNNIPLQAIHFEKPIKFNLMQFFSDVQAAIHLGLFLTKGFSATSKKEENNFIITITYQPTTTDLAFTASYQAIQHTLEFYQPVNGEKFHVIFSGDSAEISELATDLDPAVFRKLSFLSPQSILLFDALQKTEYWIPDYKTMELNDRDYYEQLPSIITQLKGKPHINDLLSEFTVIIHEATSSPLESLQESKNTEKIREESFIALRSNISPYQQDKETFDDPLQPYNIDYVTQQIVGQVDPHIAPFRRGKQLVLFVGCGTGQEIQVFKRKFPHWECFGIEPLLNYAKSARKLVGANRIFVNRLQEFTPPEGIRFDLVFIFNYNLFSLQEFCFRKLSTLVKPRGKVLIGRATSDRAHRHSYRKIEDWLALFFEKIEVLKEAKNPKSGQMVPYHQVFKQFLYGAEQPKDAKSAPPLSPLSVLINKLNQEGIEHQQLQPTQRQLYIDPVNKATMAKLVSVSRPTSSSLQEDKKQTAASQFFVISPELQAHMRFNKLSVEGISDFNKSIITYIKEQLKNNPEKLDPKMFKRLLEQANADFVYLTNCHSNTTPEQREEFDSHKRVLKSLADQYEEVSQRPTERESKQCSAATSQ